MAPHPTHEGLVSRQAARILLSIVLAATAYQAGIALQWIEGERATREAWVLLLALAAMLAGAVVVWRLRARRGALPLEAALLAPAGAAFLLARFYSFDSYFSPLRRMSETGIVPPAWVYALVGAAVAAAALTLRSPRWGRAATSIVLVLAAATAFFADKGH